MQIVGGKLFCQVARFQSSLTADPEPLTQSADRSILSSLLISNELQKCLYLTSASARRVITPHRPSWRKNKSVILGDNTASAASCPPLPFRSQRCDYMAIGYKWSWLLHISKAQAFSVSESAFVGWFYDSCSLVTNSAALLLFGTDGDSECKTTSSDLPSDKIWLWFLDFFFCNMFAVLLSGTSLFTCAMQLHYTSHQKVNFIWVDTSWHRRIIWFCTDTLYAIQPGSGWEMRTDMWLLMLEWIKSQGFRRQCQELYLLNTISVAHVSCSIISYK